MQRLFIFLVFLTITSCNYFDVKKIASEDILKEELKTFNWNNVDVYPSFTSCDSTLTKQEKKYCFENTLSSLITNGLKNETIVVSQDINDTIMLEFQISETGKLELKSLKIDSITKREIPKIETFLLQNLDSLPKIFPALKRDQPVKTEFTLPVIVKVN